MSDDKRLQQLLDELTELERSESYIDPEKIAAVAGEILKLDSGNPRAKLAAWASLEDEEAEDSLHLLEEALEVIRPIVQQSAAATLEDDVDAEVYGSVLECLSIVKYNMEQFEEAVAYAKELVAFDDEGLYEGRTPLYCSLLVLERYDQVLEELEGDPIETLVGEYARAFALHGNEGDSSEAVEAMLQAISMTPDLPFFILGIWGMSEDEEDEEILGMMQQAMALSAPCHSSPERMAFLATPAYMLGYLTDRITDPEEIGLIREGFESAGYMDQLEDAKSEIFEMQERKQTQEEIDEEALQAIYQILAPEEE